MRRSEFERAVREEFGDRGGALVADLALSALEYQTANEALTAGERPRDVWLALCGEMDVPVTRRYGVGRLDPRER